uniref:Uncharacterized protein n=1 Tax=Trichobilharzia regenti TaxID=157069 RepID=A0AA85JDD5_TRIRE|nr:unnamed protein product [Trichobilharzia regenti]
MARSSQTKEHGMIQTVVVRKLPANMDEDTLRKIVPSAKTLVLSKRTDSIKALITFSTQKGYFDALCRLRRTNFNGIKPVISSFYPKSNDKCKIEPENVELTIQDLPQTITVSQLKREFPTAVSIKLRVDLWDIGNRSCLLKFQCSEDLEDVYESCHRRMIGGQTIKAVVGAQSTLHYELSEANDIQGVCGIKLIQVSQEINDDKIREHFPEGSLVEYHSVSNGDSNNTRNVFIRFKKQPFNWPLIIKLKNNVFSGKHFEVRSWNCDSEATGSHSEEKKHSEKETENGSSNKSDKCSYSNPDIEMKCAKIVFPETEPE